jgi:hypothetical protein
MCVELVVFDCPVLSIWERFLAILHQLAIGPTLAAGGECSASDVQTIENVLIVFDYQLCHDWLVGLLCLLHFTGVSCIFVAHTDCFSAC